MLKLYFNKRDEIEKVVGKSFEDENVIVFGFNGIKTINYKRELSGEESVLANLAKLSRECKKVVICGAVTDNYGILKKSVVIAENGKVLGISDMNLCYDNSSFSCGGGYRVYQTKIGRIGILVDEDITDVEVVKSMSQFGADVIIAVLSNGVKPQYDSICRTYSFLFGVPFAIFSQSGVIAGDINGEICAGSISDESHIIIPIKKCYRQVIFKKRGIKP